MSIANEVKNNDMRSRFSQPVDDAEKWRDVRFDEISEIILSVFTYTVSAC